MKTRRILSTILALTMLLTLFGGEFASAAGMKIVTAGEELAYDPLAETASVAYEQHDAGYAVSLDRAADSVTMHVTAVPGSRSADKAKLYVRTGVALKAGVAYRVSFALSSEKQLADYTVHFDGDTAAAYGKLDKRSVEAGGTDRVEYALTPKAANGELVLCLLLGKTEVNTLHFSDLAVEEAPAEQSGANKLLVDKLNYAAPGAIRCAAEAGYSAEMSSTDTSATMSITNVPSSKDAAVWKLKLMVATGLKPEPGKTYRFHATLNSSNSGSYEICYNEGEVEKGYDVLYNQSLKNGNQTVERMIYVPTDKENPGELIVQFSLGKLSKGTKVTVSKVTVEEASPAYTNALAKGFALDATDRFETYDSNNLTVSSSSPVDTTFRYNGNASVSVTGDRSGGVLNYGDRVAVLVNPTSNPDHNVLWGVRLNLETDIALEANSFYKVSFTILAEKAYDEYEVKFGSGFADDTDGKTDYGTKKLALAAGSPATVERTFKTSDAGGLLIQLLLGKTDANGNRVDVSEVKVQKLTEGTPEAVSASVTYPSGVLSKGTFENRDDKGTLIGNGSSATYTRDGDVAGWQCGLFANNICAVKGGSTYYVSYDIQSDKAAGKEFSANYNHSEDRRYEHDDGSIKHTVSSEKASYTDKIIPGGDGNLYLRFDVGETDGGTNVTVSNIKVTEKVSNVAYPGSFENRDGKGELSGDGTSATYTRDGNVAGWQSGLFANNICAVESGETYFVKYNILFEEEPENCLEENKKWFPACYNYSEGAKYTTNGEGRRKEHNGSGEYTDTLTANENGNLYLFIELGSVSGGKKATISNLEVTKQLDISVTYPTAFLSGSFENRDGKGELSGDGTSATYTRDGSVAGWQSGLFANNICAVESGLTYHVSYDIQSSSAEEMSFSANYNHSEDRRYEHDDGSISHPVTNTKASYTDDVVAGGDGYLYLRFDVGDTTDGTEITVSNIAVKKTPLVPSGAPTDISFSSFGVEVHDGYTAPVTRHNDYVSIHMTKPEAADPATWKAKLCVRTDQVYQAGKNYRFVFEIEADEDLGEFCVITKGLSDSEDVRGTWGLSLTAGQKKTITTRAIPANRANGALGFDVELGKFNGGIHDVTFAIRNVELQEVTGGPSQREVRETGTVTNDAQENYTAPLTRAKDSATVSINMTPATGMEAWKHKLFIDTGVNVNEGEAYRVVFDTLAENDMDFEVCYNRGSTEKGFTAVYGLHAAAGKTKTVEKMVFAENSGKLIVQLSLGNVPAPNKVTVSNLRVDRAKYSYSGKSALPAEISYQAGDVSYWAHADYNARFTNTADAVTAHITPPAKNPEPWKVKLFLDTGVALKGGKYYKVTADVSAKKSQNYEICYNNGGVEFGYDSMGGLKVTGGKTERIEKLISVPAGKTDTNNLMLQFNLGKTAIANEVTIGGVTVEEVTLAYANAMGKDFSYQKSLSTWTDPKTSYKATLDSAADAATLHISDVPASGTGVWMVKLFVHTGAMLEAGKSYQVSADLLAAKAQDFETCFNNEETEKGFDAIYGQKLAAGVKTTVDKRISVPASMTDAGELVLQFSVGGAVANDITVSNISVQELQYGGSGTSSVPDTVIGLSQSAQAAGTLDVTREKLTYRMTKIAADAKDNAIRIAGADLRSGDLYAVAFTARASKELTGTLALAPSGGKSAVISKTFTLTPTEQTYSFTTADALAEGGAYDIFWQFGSADNQKLGSADVELSGISVSVPTERLEVVRSVQKVTVNGEAVSPDVYNINGSNYFKLRDLAVLLNGTNGQFVVRYNPQTNGVSLTTDKAYTAIGGELTTGPDLAATCVRSPQDVAVNGKAVNLKVYNIGGSNFFRLRDLNELLGFDVDYEAKTNTVLIASPLTPERQEASYAYNVFFRPEIDGESQPYVGDTMPFYDNGTYYIYYLKEGGDSYNHSVYLTTTRDFVSYQEYDDPVLSASRADVQDSWIGTGSVVKVDKNYYFFYTGFNASGSQEYHEKIMVAKGSSPTSFTKVGGWSITPPAELNQKNDFRDPQAYYDPATGTISLTVTASKDGTARILKYTLGKDLSNVKYDGVIFTDPTGAFYNLECSDTFRLGNKWYLTYSGQEDTLWYASADSRFGPYSAPKRMDGTLFYAAKHVENGKNSYMVGWTRRSASASSTDEVSGWGGNLAVQQLRQNADGSLSMIPADSIASAFSKSVASSATSATLNAGSGYSYKKAFTSSESFKLTGEFTCADTGSLGLAFDFDGTEDQYKLISVDPAEGKLKLLFNGGATQIAETQAKVAANQKHTFTYIQDGSVGIFYLDGQAALTVRLYGVTDKPIYLFAENNSVTFTSLRQFTR